MNNLPLLEIFRMILKVIKSLKGKPKDEKKTPIKKHSRKSFKRSSGHHPKNSISPRSMRGGIRL